jgi:hypothetical protein
MAFRDNTTTEITIQKLLTDIYIEINIIGQNHTHTIQLKPKSTIRDLFAECSNRFSHYKRQFILKTGTIILGSIHAKLDIKLTEIWKDTVQIPSIELLTSDYYDNINTIYNAKILSNFTYQNVPINLHGKCIVNKKRIGRGAHIDIPSQNNHYTNLIIIITPFGNYLVNVHAFCNLLSGAHIDPMEHFDARIKFNKKSFIVPKRTVVKDILDRYICKINKKSQSNNFSNNFNLPVYDLVKGESLRTKIGRLFNHS